MPCPVSRWLLLQGKSAADIGDWIREHSGDAADAPEFAEFLAMQLFPHMLGPSAVSLPSLTSNDNICGQSYRRPTCDTSFLTVFAL